IALLDERRDLAPVLLALLDLHRHPAVLADVRRHREARIAGDQRRLLVLVELRAERPGLAALVEAPAGEDLVADPHVLRAPCHRDLGLGQGDAQLLEARVRRVVGHARILAHALTAIVVARCLRPSSRSPAARPAWSARSSPRWRGATRRGGSRSRGRAW